ncbi:MAG: IS982 family transposase [Candidatus Paceibacterota bacterium]|jgi:hypothetical protein
MTLSHHTNSQTILLLIFCFVDDFIKGIFNNIKFALARPDQNTPPTKKHNLSIAEIVALCIFRFFSGIKNWKDFYRHVRSYHAKDFPNLPNYQNFISAANRLSGFAAILIQGFMQIFKNGTSVDDKKFTDSTRLPVCEIKREFSHKVAKNIATKSKSTMGWFYGFRLHIISNELLQILSFKITTATVDERVALEMMWKDIFGMIIADAGYIGKEWKDKAAELGKNLFTGVRANMKKIMTEAQHQLFKLRQKVEIVFSVLKLRFGLVTTLPRPELGYLAHYLWCIAAYQLKKFFELMDKNVENTDIAGLLA